MSISGTAPVARAAPRAVERLLLVTDAWRPQVNGVVRTWERVIAELRAQGVEVEVIAPEGFRSMPLPTYTEIRLALVSPGRIARLMEEARPDAIHVATEGPLGALARRACLKRGWPFTTSFHTRFHDYVHARTRIPPAWTLEVLRRFHAPASAVLATTPTMRDELASAGFGNLRVWTRGVDSELFRPREDADLGLEEPVWVYVGRVAVEKNIAAFLELDLPGTKLVVGEGPQREELQKRFPDVVFAGARFGEDLARHYAGADVFVFPSRTDTFGLVLIEALACGVPVAAYPLPGPIDIVTNPEVGALDEDLGSAAKAALGKSPEACRRHALRYTWPETARILYESLAPLR